MPYSNGYYIQDIMRNPNCGGCNININVGAVTLNGGVATFKEQWLNSYNT
jgi:hypothetical protein